MQQCVRFTTLSITCDASVVLGFRSRKRSWKTKQNICVELCSLVELAQPQSRETEAGQQSGREFRRRQVPIPKIQLRTASINETQIRRPNVMKSIYRGFVCIERVVHLHGDAVRVNDVLNEGLRIRHGIQRFATPSGRTEEIEQDELATGLRLGKGIVDGCCPWDRCVVSSCGHVIRLQSVNEVQRARRPSSARVRVISSA
jgi:hypothetical protein